MLTRRESIWSLIRTVAAVVSVFIQLTGIVLLVHYNHVLLLHK
jgi:hypothetical protein